MSKFAVIATYEIAPDRIEVFLPILRAHRDRCLRDEPGTLHFEILRPEKNLMLYEVYENEAAFEAHRNGSMVVRFRDEAAKVERKLTFITCTILD
jgi:(4S)-4-hydroxy-5-phosphonooxypentane-2,3-dione isomerase